MKRLTLKKSQFGSGEVLSRYQMKNVLGGVEKPTTTKCLADDASCGSLTAACCHRCVGNKCWPNDPV